MLRWLGLLGEIVLIQRLPQQGLDHAALSFEEARDALSLIGKTGDRFG